MAEIDRASVVQSDDSKKMRTLQVVVLADEARDDIEHFEPYGFTSRPKAPADKKGAEAIVATLGGTSDLGVAIVVADRRYRVTGLEEGEVCIHDDQGQKVHLTRDGIVIETPTGKDVTVTCGKDVSVTATNATVSATVKAVVKAPAVELGDTPNPLDGVVVGTGVDPFTGVQYALLGSASTVVKAKKV